MNKKTIEKLRALKSGGTNCLILPDGHKVDCDGAIHERVCNAAGTTLKAVIKAGIARVHFDNSAETFAIECGTELTFDQSYTAKSILKTVEAHILLSQIKGVFNVKSNFGHCIRGI